MWMFDEDLDEDLEEIEEIDEAAGAWDADPVDPAFTEAGGADHGGTNASEIYDFGEGESALRAPSSSPSTTRRRGRRGSGHGGSNAGGGQKKWRSGHIPPPPAFAGDVEGDPYCLRHYRRALERWCLITAEYLPKSEQALRALDSLTGDAALEVEEIPDSKYFRDDGIEVLLKDLEAAFGEREIYRRGCRASVDAFVRRYKLYERKLQDAKVAAYPSETRAVKLLDGLRMSEQATSQLLLAARNRYDMDAILNALKVQYPPGLTLTGLARHPTAISTHVKGRGRGNHGRGRSRSGGSFKWRTWHTEAQEDEIPEDNTVPETFTGYEAYEISNDIAAENANDLLDDAFEYQFDDYEADFEDGVPEQAPEEGYDDGPEEQAEAFTATSKKMASATQSRGYYLSAAELLRRDCPHVTQHQAHVCASSTTLDGEGMVVWMVGHNKMPPTDMEADSEDLGVEEFLPEGMNPDDALDAADEWALWQMEAHQANEFLERQAASSVAPSFRTAVTGPSSSEWRSCDTPPPSSSQGDPEDFLDALDDAHFWRLEAEGCLSELRRLEQEEQNKGTASSCAALEQEAPNDRGETEELQPSLSVTIPSMTTYVQYSQEPALVIIDTGCQKQVAGKHWHAAHHELLQMPRLAFPEKCQFKFGPNRGTSSTTRYAYPSGMGGHFTVLFFSCVSDDAPALMSRNTLATLDGLVDICRGEVIYQALQTKQLLTHLFNFMNKVLRTALGYAATSMSPNLRDRVLQQMPPCTAVTMMSTVALSSVQASLNLTTYEAKPEDCRHPRGLRAYGAGGQSARICDMCGFRAVVHKGQMVPVAPKASPHAKTPLDLPDHVAKASKSKAKSKAQSKAAGKAGLSGQWPSGLGPSSPSYQDSSSTASPGLDPLLLKQVEAHALKQVEEQVEKRLELLVPKAVAAQRQQMEADQASNMSWDQIGGAHWWSPASWETDHEHQEEEDFAWNLEDNDAETEGPEQNFEQMSLTWLKPGKQKRLLGTIRQMQQLWMVELSIYDTLVQHSRWLRRSKADLVEIYAGHGNISEYALGKGLRVLQPVDKVFGTELNTKKDFDWLTQSLSYWKPLLTVVEPECRLWSSLTNLNYFWRPDELAQLRDEAQVTVEGVARLLRDILDDGRLFLLENPHAGKFWSQPAIVKLMSDYQLFYDYGEMCMYNLRGRAGHLIRKPTGWLTNKAELLQAVNCKCNGNHEHEPCMGTNSKLAAVYTRTLAKSVVDKFLGFLHHGTPRPGMPEMTEAEEPYADLKKDIDAWRPLLKEAAERLEGKVAVSAEIKPGAFLEQIKALVPWHIAYTQIYRTPKMRRLPTRQMMDLPFSHRAAVLLFADGSITIESESIAGLANPNARFEKNVRVGIFIYGDPVSLSSSQHRARASLPPPLPEPEEIAVDDWKIPDISFPGISEDQTPKWMQGVLRRVHSNLGHPPQSVMVRMLAQAGAAPAALIGARALRCGVCERAKPLKEARPAKAVGPKRFNQRLMLDLVFCKDAAGETFTFLNQLDEATTYQALTLIPNRESGTINQVLIKGWFQFFGLPETLLIDAEGALKSFSFEELTAQSNVAVRYVPPDAHYQLGKCERHGAMARAILRKLIDEHGLIGADEMTTGAVMACHAKNSLARRAGCAPAQWVFGQLPRLPASVLSEADNPEAMEMTSLSSKLQRTEQLRYAAMQAFLSFDNDDQLRRHTGTGITSRRRSGITEEFYGTEVLPPVPEDADLMADPLPPEPRDDLPSETTLDQTNAVSLAEYETYTISEQWSWLTLANVETDLDVNDFDLNKKMVIYHTLFDGQQHFMTASHFEDWLDAQANLVSYSETAETFQTYLLNGTNNNIKMQDTSDEEDGGLKRTQRQALKRELPWRSIPTADWPAFIDSITKEWNEWKKWSSCIKFTGDPSTVPKHLILPSRVCYRWKPIDGGTSHKAQACIVIQGFRDPHLPLLSRDAPVLSRIGLMALLQWAASMGTDLVNGDCKSAFLQGKPDDERPEKIYMRVPQDGISLAAIEDWNNAPDTLYQLTAPVYGAANAPRRWYIHVRETMESLGWQVHSLDPCLFLKFNGTKVIAVLGIHVDDILASSLEPGVLKEVEGSFTWGSEWEVNDFVFIGRRIVKHSNHTITLSQSHYAADVFVSRVKGDANEPIGNNQELMSEFRSAIGSLQWMSGTTRPDIASETSLLQKAQAELTLQDLMDANTTLRYIKATADSHIMVKPIPLENLVLISYGDAAFGNAPGGKSQGGYLVLASTEEALHGEAEASLLDWKSFRHQRVLRSTLAAEAASLDRSEDSANFIGCLLGELVIEGYVASHSSRSPFPVWPVTDARSLYDSIHRLATTFSEKRVEMDVAALRSTCRNLRWVPTGEMKADALTKRSRALRDALRKWAQNPTVSLTEARDPDTSLDPNAPWRPVKATKNVTSANLMSCS
ncbi:Retrovirus-related Pol polyprotein from transposon RE1 (Retro element 1) (AtRE1) [Includes: Protease RE1 [Durusdinium trenchii]|uniref:Retrovirus-related Pol polyprotein from transposon RE1 (Retro element 1) (AtRE1) n=1 Tax=Durusdinium trenchii TaxID=1381693 RepID=A0ABP0IDA5_9DINO